MEGIWMVAALFAASCVPTASAGFTFPASQRKVADGLFDDKSIPDEALYYETIQPTVKSGRGNQQFDHSKDSFYETIKRAGKSGKDRQHFIHTLFMRPAPTLPPPLWRPPHHRDAVILPYIPLIGGYNRARAPWRQPGPLSLGFPPQQGVGALSGLHDGDALNDEPDATNSHVPSLWPDPNRVHPMSSSFEWPLPHFSRLHWTPVLTNLWNSHPSSGTGHVDRPVVIHKRKIVKLKPKPVTKSTRRPEAEPEEKPEPKLAETTPAHTTENPIENPTEWTLDAPFEWPLNKPATETTVELEVNPAVGPVPEPPENPVGIATDQAGDGEPSDGSVTSVGSGQPENANVLPVSSGSIISTFKFPGPLSEEATGSKPERKGTALPHSVPGEQAHAPAKKEKTSAPKTTKKNHHHHPSSVTTSGPRPEKEMSDTEVMKAFNFNPPGLIMEMAVFYDVDSKKSFTEALGSSNGLEDAIKTIISQVQVFYKSPWLKTPLHIIITQLRLLDEEANQQLKTEEADRLLKGFSNFTAKTNAHDDQPGHWDVALLLTGKDMHAAKDGKKDTSVLGKAYLGGVCTRDFGNVIVEFGSTNPRRRPMTTFGLQTSDVAAHELAHSLGVHHDGPPENNDCSLDRYLMGPWRTSNTTTWWSPCSLQVLTKLHENDKMACLKKAPSVKRLRQVLHLNSWRSSPPPGQQWDADAQCRVFLKSDAARCSIKPENMSAVCRALQCKSPERIGLFGAGHALEGTYCGDNNWCQGTKCVPFPKSAPVVPGGWSDWETVSECSKPCIQHSVALMRMKRTCNDPRRQNTLEGCEGDSVKLRPCDINANKKAPKCTQPKTNQQYIDEKCALLARSKPELKPKGTQVPYSAAQSWRACAIHCGYKGDAYIAAKFFLNEQTNETGVLPDGTRCHFDKSKGAAYYCQQGQCVTLLRSLAGIQDTVEGQVLDVEDSDWAPDTEGRRLVEKYLEYVPGKEFAVLDPKKVPRARARIAVDDL
ncbi:A disintegrin and metalloproteinase with thrombospondin motifs 4-like [Dermacentor albipictus]|uniref:A disintegrin and metalloproteinase with thrombospondin motifs 4-like n=1 Tax=Dermacentor albipictus TaxID=60249 RepID=UPI0031FD44CC